MNTLISIITPTYNRGYVLWKTIQSVQKQIYPNWELIIIDDGSVDNTQQVVAEFQKDPRIKYIKIKNGGVCKARNKGIKEAKGDLITYLDSDDYFYEHCLSTAREFFQKYPEKVFAAPNYNRKIELYDKEYKLIDFTEASSSQKLEVTLQDIYHWKVKCGYGTGFFHKRFVIEEGVAWDENLHVFDDWDFCLQLGRKYPEGFLHIPYVLFEYLQKYGLDGKCAKTTYQEWAEGFKKIYQKHKEDPLMQGQIWYPQRVEKYTQMQKDFEAGVIHSAEYKYFPEYFQKDK